MVAKILDDNKPKKSPKSLFTLFQISPILFNSIKYGKSRQNFLWDSIYRYLRKRKRQFLFCVHVLVVQRRQRNVKIAWCTSKVIGCLPFTWANRSVYGLGKWYAKFRTGKFSSGIAFTICTDQFHLTENGREGLKLVSKMAEEMEHEFPLRIFHPEKQDYLFRCSVAPGNFPLGRPKKSCSIYVRTGFAGKFL